MWLWPAAMQLPREEAKDKPLPSAGWGCASVIAVYVLVPIAALLVFVVALLGGLVTLGQLFGDIMGIGGSTLALFTLTFGFVLSIVTKAIVAFLGGRLIVERLMSDFSGSKWANFGALALGLVILPHGAQKLLGWFGGSGLSGTMQFFTENMGIPWILAFVVILAESLGALGLIGGAATERQVVANVLRVWNRNTERRFHVLDIAQHTAADDLQDAIREGVIPIVEGLEEKVRSLGRQEAADEPETQWQVGLLASGQGLGPLDVDCVLGMTTALLS